MNRSVNDTYVGLYYRCYRKFMNERIFEVTATEIKTSQVDK